MRRIRLAALLLAALAALTAAPVWAAVDDTRLVSRASGPDGVKGDANSFVGAISRDGRFVGFHSSSTALHPDDGAMTNDVYVRDRQTATTILVSRADGATGPAGDANSFDADMSPDGRFVAFSSLANNLDDAPPDALSDVYVRDLVAETTTSVSPEGDGDSASQPAISADGRFVAFASRVGEAPSDVVVRDTLLGTTTLVSQSSDEVPGNGSSFAPSISADGNLVAFTSVSSNLDPNDTDTSHDVFVRDIAAGTTTLISRALNGEPNGFSNAARVAADGRFVTFSTSSTNLVPEGVPGVMVRDLDTGRTTLASRGVSGEPAGGGAATPGVPNSSTISADGRFVAWPSFATNVHPDDGDTLSDVYVRDLAAGTTTLASRASGATGAKGDGSSGNNGPPLISGDGSVVAFESVATNLDPADSDEVLDVFTRELGGAASPPPPPPPAGGSQTPTPPPVTQQGPTPVAGRSQVVEPVSGTVLVRRRGTRRFVRLRAERLLGDRFEFDARRGVIRIVVADPLSPSGFAEALARGGRAVVHQSRRSPFVTTLRLSQPLARPRAKSKASAAQRRKKRRRRARSRSLFTETDGGRFRTRGNYGAATASGTEWQTTDRLRTTRFVAREGTIRVRDFGRRRTVTVRAPNSYTARKRTGGARQRARRTPSRPG